MRLRGGVLSSTCDYLRSLLCLHKLLRLLRWRYTTCPTELVLRNNLIHAQICNLFRRKQIIRLYIACAIVHIVVILL